jgi:hypothetical protein
VSHWMYVAGCLALPALWGAVSYVGFDYIRRKMRSRATPPRADVPPADYMI